MPEGHTSASFTELVLEQAAVVVSPGSAYGPSGEGFFRISLTVPDERLEEAVRRIDDARSRERHNSSVTDRQPDPAPGAEPERGFVVAVLAPRTIASDELAELRELARTAGVEPVGELVQQRGAARSADLRRARASSRS